MPEDLIDVESRSGFHSDAGELCDQDRDIVKRWRKLPFEFVMVGLENQEWPDPDMLYRNFSYDGSSYRMEMKDDDLMAFEARMPQAADAPGDAIPDTVFDEATESTQETATDVAATNDDNGEKDADGDTQVPKALKKRRIRYPVTTFVLYFGIERRWTSPRSIHEAFQLDPRLKPFVPTYHINVIEVAWLEPEVIEKFKSDFRLVALFLRNQRLTGRFDIGKDPMPNHIAAVLDFIRTRLKDVHNEEDFRKKLAEGGYEMDFFNKALKEKYDEGEEKGIENTLLCNIRNLMVKLRMTAEQAMDLLDIPQQQHSHYLEALQKG